MIPCVAKGKGSWRRKAENRYLHSLYVMAIFRKDFRDPEAGTTSAFRSDLRILVVLPLWIWRWRSTVAGWYLGKYLTILGSTFLKSSTPIWYACSPWKPASVLHYHSPFGRWMVIDVFPTHRCISNESMESSMAALIWGTPNGLRPCVLTPKIVWQIAVPEKRWTSQLFTTIIWQHWSVLKSNVFIGDAKLPFSGLGASSSFKLSGVFGFHVFILMLESLKKTSGNTKLF